MKPIVALVLPPTLSRERRISQAIGTRDVGTGAHGRAGQRAPYAIRRRRGCSWRVFSAEARGTIRWRRAPYRPLRRNSSARSRSGRIGDSVIGIVH